MPLCYCMLLMTTMFVSTVASQGGTVINVYRSDPKDVNNKVTCQSTGVVAFSVGRKKYFAPTSTSRVLMDHVFYNKGGYFNVKTSIFTAPVSGVYAFFFGGSGQSGKLINLRLHAGKPERAVAATYNDNKQYGQASGSVIIEMKSGEDASVWLYRGRTINGHTPPSMQFNGYLIYKTKDK